VRVTGGGRRRLPRKGRAACCADGSRQSWQSIFGEDGYQRELFTRALDRFAFGAAPSAADVAEAVVFLASPKAAHVTGQTLSVNGGLSFAGW
jgi:3-oxoacyl-[acyl-carrier protein] reductase